MLVSESFAKKVFGAADPIGRLIDSDEPTTIVGVVGDVRYVGRDLEAAPAVYYPHSAAPRELICLVARTASDAGDLGPAVRRAIAEIDPAIPAMNITTIDRIVSESVADRRFTVTATTAFAAVALLLTVVGIAAVVGRTVVERRRELAIRTALGASRGASDAPRDAAGTVPAAAGTVMGLGAGLRGVDLLERFLFDVTPREPAVYLAVAGSSARRRSWPACCRDGGRDTRCPPPSFAPSDSGAARAACPAVASAKAGGREPVNPPAGSRTCRHAKRSKLSVAAAQVVTGDRISAHRPFEREPAMSRSSRNTLAVFGVLFGLSVWTWQPLAQTPAAPPRRSPPCRRRTTPRIPYETIEGYFKMPEGRTWGSTSAVDIDRDGKSIWVAERCGANNCWVDGKMSHARRRAEVRSVRQAGPQLRRRHVRLPARHPRRSRRQRLGHRWAGQPAAARTRRARLMLRCLRRPRPSSVTGHQVQSRGQSAADAGQGRRQSPGRAGRPVVVLSAE